MLLISRLREVALILQEQLNKSKLMPIAKGSGATSENITAALRNYSFEFHRQEWTPAQAQTLKSFSFITPDALQQTLFEGDAIGGDGRSYLFKGVLLLDHFVEACGKLCESKSPYSDSKTGRIAFMFPGTAFRSLEEMNSELARLNRHLRHLVEGSGAETREIALASVDSSSFDLFLECAPVAAAAISVAIERIVALYKTVLQIKKLKLELSDRAYESQVTDGLDTTCEKLVAVEVDKIRDQIFADFASDMDEARRNELQTPVRDAVVYISTWIDSGLIVEALLPEDSENVRGGNGSAMSDLRLENERILGLEYTPAKKTTGNNESVTQTRTPKKRRRKKT